MIDSQLFSKRNVIIVCSLGLSILGIGFIVYTNKQKTLYSQLWNKIDSSSDDGVGAGIQGNWRDVYDYTFWSPSYLSTAGASTPTLDYTNAKADAEKIYKAGTGLIHNQSDVVSVFATLKNRSDLAKLSQMFASLKYGDLKDFLKGFMEGGIVVTNYMPQIYDILKKLPK